MPAELTLAQLALLVLLVLILGLLGMWVAWMCLRTWRRTHTHNHSKTIRRPASDIWQASGHRLEKKFNEGKSDRQDDPLR